MNGGNETQDKIFVLSISEAKKYYSSDNERKAYATDYLYSKGNEKADRFDFWWLRTPGSSNNFAIRILDDGAIDRGGFHVNRRFAVRPALWLNLQ